VDLLPERTARPGKWWSFAPTAVLLAVGLPFIVAAIAWAADLVTAFTWVQLLAVVVLSAIGFYYLVAAGMSADAARPRRGAHAPRPGTRTEPRIYA
jgi:hypothetical protein